MQLETVFPLSGRPTITFVEPNRYQAVLVSCRTAGRCMVIEGPSGVGKTTTLTNALEHLDLANRCTFLSARRPSDAEIIQALPTINDIGIVVVDDFHRLDTHTQGRLSDFMKVLADSENETSKLILVGINNAGQQLIKHGTDLGLRFDLFRIERNPDEKISDLISKGEEALNIKISKKQDLAQLCQGSFHLAQVLCHYLCLEAGITEHSETKQIIEVSPDVVVERVMDDLARQFEAACLTFARGTKIRREGRAPYLHILRWLAETDDGALDLTKEIKRHRSHVASVGQVLEKGYLAQLIEEKQNQLGAFFHYDSVTRVLAIEDPKMAFFLRHIVWRNFTRSAGFTSDQFQGAYDFALSFAGDDRPIAEAIAHALKEREITVFYDADEQHRILAKNIEDYLAPIYRSEARFVLPILSPRYPQRIWTKFESDSFKKRFGKEAVIPIRLGDCVDSSFTKEFHVGSLKFDLTVDREAEAARVADSLARKLIESKGESDV